MTQQVWHQHPLLLHSPPGADACPVPPPRATVSRHQPVAQRSLCSRLRAHGDGPRGFLPSAGSRLSTTVSPDLSRAGRAHPGEAGRNEGQRRCLCHVGPGGRTRGQCNPHSRHGVSAVPTAPDRHESSRVVTPAEPLGSSLSGVIQPFRMQGNSNFYLEMLPDQCSAASGPKLRGCSGPAEREGPGYPGTSGIRSGAGPGWPHARHVPLIFISLG